MKLPRYSLRTLFVLVAIAGLISLWAVRQLEWIKERRQFIDTKARGFVMLNGWPKRRTAAPWSLRIFGEKSWETTILVEEGQVARGRDLFPEADFRIMVVDEQGLGHVR